MNKINRAEEELKSESKEIPLQLDNLHINTENVLNSLNILSGRLQKILSQMECEVAPDENKAESMYSEYGEFLLMENYKLVSIKNIIDELINNLKI